MKLAKQVLIHLKDDSLYRNSIYLMASTAVLAILGFVFWVVVARLFKTEEVGIATTLIAVTTLISGFSLLGLNISLVRFLPKSDKKNEMISTSLILVVLASLLSAAIFLFKIDTFSPTLLFLRGNLVYLGVFIMFVLATSMSNILDSVFMAYRASENILLRNSVLSVMKIGFIYFLIAYGAYGIFSSFAFATLVSFVISFGILILRYKFSLSFRINSQIVKKLGNFSVGNYIAGFLYQVPSLILPVIIINSLHAKVAAYYYIDSMILNLLIVIPAAASQSLLTEGSHDETKLKEHIRKAVRITELLFLPSIPLVLIFGGVILRFFGENYQADAFRFLQVISLSSIFMSVVLFGGSILKIQHKIKTLIILNLIGCILVLVSSYSLISYGFIGVGIGWTIGQLLFALLFIGYLFRSKILGSDKPAPSYQHTFQ